MGALELPEGLFTDSRMYSPYLVSCLSNVSEANGAVGQDSARRLSVGAWTIWWL